MQHLKKKKYSRHAYFSALPNMAEGREYNVIDLDRHSTTSISTHFRATFFLEFYDRLTTGRIGCERAIFELDL